jgi:hypothetical protein
VPTTNDDVTIAIGSARLDSTDAAAFAKSLTTSAPLAVDRQTLTVDGDVSIGADLSLHAANLSLNGNLALSNNATLFINLGYSNPGSRLIFTGATGRTITGTGTINSLTDDQTSHIVNDTRDASDAGQQLTIASGVGVIGQGVVMESSYIGGQIVNSGDVSVRWWNFGTWGKPPEENGTFVNYGSVTVEYDTTGINFLNMPGASVTVLDGTFTLEGDWDNNGTLSLVDPGTLNLGGTFEFADVGTFTRSGGTVNVVGTLDNVGDTLALDATTGPWNFFGTLLGGTYQSVAPNHLTVYGGTFDGVTVNSPLDLLHADLLVRNGLTINSTLTLQHSEGASSQLIFDGDVNQTINGTGTIASVFPPKTDGFNNIVNRMIDDGTGLVLTIGSGVTVSGPRFQVYQQHKQGTIVNDGTIDVTDSYLGNANGSFVNNGSISGIGLLYTANLLNSPGKTVDATDGDLYLDGNWHNAGTISLTDSNLHLRGTFVFGDLGTFSRAGTGDVYLEGTLDNTASTFTIDNSIGDLRLAEGGQILNGTVNATGGHRLIGMGGYLTNVTLDAPMTIAQGHPVYLVGDLTLNSTITLGDAADNSGGSIQFWDFIPQAINGTGNIVVVGDGASAINNFFVEHRPVTIGSCIEISGKSLTHFGFGPLINYGTLTPDGAGSAWVLGAGGWGFENRGTVAVSNGAFLDIHDMTNTAGHGIVVGAGAALRLTSNTFQNDGTIDVNGSLIVDYGGTSPVGTIQSSITTARNGGDWLGPAGITSTAARDNPLHNTTLGVMEATEFKVLRNDPNAVFAGQTLDDHSVLVKYTYYGDATFDGRITFDDYVRIDTGFNAGRTGWSNGDFNGDGSVNFDDYVLIDIAFNTQTSVLGRVPKTRGPTRATSAR